MDQGARWARLARAGAVVAAIAFPVIELLRVGALLTERDLLVALAGTAVVLPLHVRHVLAGARGQAPEHGRVTLAVMAVVMAVVTADLGTAYVFSLTSLVVSGFIVLRLPWSCLAAFAVLALGAGVAVLHPFEGPIPLGAAYAAALLMFRATVQLVFVTLAATLHELASTQGALARTALSDHRDRVQDHLRRSLSDDIAVLAARCRSCLDAVRSGSASAGDSLVAVGEAARDLLERTRTVVASYRGDADREQLRAAGNLLRGRPVLPLPASAPSPVEGVTANRRRALALLAAAQAAMTVFLVGQGLGAFDVDGSWRRFGATALLLVLGSWVIWRAAAGRSVHPGWLVAVAGAAVPVVVVSAPSVASAQIVWIVVPAAALALRGRARVVVTVAVLTCSYAAFLVEGFTSVGLSALDAVWIALYFPVVAGLGATGLYAAAATVRVVTAVSADRAELAARAVEADRRRMSRDLHDVLGQAFSAISLKADVARALVARGSDRAVDEAAEIVVLASSLDDEMTSAALGRRTTSWQDEVARATELLEAAGVEVSVVGDLELRDPEVESMFAWVVREGTTNVLRHSDATRVEVRVGVQENRLVLAITNDGRTGPLPPPGTGLAGLRDRARAVDGDVTTSVGPTSFTLVATAPAPAPLVREVTP